MNMKRKILFVCFAFLALLQGWAQHTWQAGPVNLELIQRGDSEFTSLVVYMIPMFFASGRISRII